MQFKPCLHKKKALRNGKPFTMIEWQIIKPILLLLYQQLLVKEQLIVRLILIRHRYFFGMHLAKPHYQQ